MKKIVCNECGIEFNNDMNMCPNCGCPVSYSTDYYNELLVEDTNQYYRIKLYFDYFEIISLLTELFTKTSRKIDTTSINNIEIIHDNITGNSQLKITLKTDRIIKQNINKKNIKLWKDAIEIWKHYKVSGEKDNNYVIKKEKTRINNINEAEDIYIQVEGNRMQAIKIIKEKLNISNDEALELINQIHKKYDNKSSLDNSVQKFESQSLGLVDTINALSKNMHKDNDLKADNTIKVKIEQPDTKIISSTTNKSVISTLIRGLIGRKIGGPFGALVGISTGKNKTKTTFVTKGILGNKKVVTAKNNSRKFKRLAKKL